MDLITFFLSWLSSPKIWLIVKVGKRFVVWDSKFIFHALQQMNLDYITSIASVVIVNDYARKFMGKTLKYP
mgnify:CR=1 FL=1